jgi:uncharacterized protein YbaA (DUF1428 family)
MEYVDGFLLAVPRRNLAEYRRIARAAGKIWKEFGAIDYRECVGDDVSSKAAKPFGRSVRLKKGEVVVFSWIVYKSKSARDRCNKKIMKDPRIAKMMDQNKPVFDMKRMAYGGFKVLVDV